jgi:metal-sulfur cluster biosynthetic enzyme
VERVLDTIVDPCGAATGIALGLAEMGIAEVLDVSSSSARVRLVPTTPSCLFVGLFEDEIRTRVQALDWCDQVDVELAPGDLVWDERRMTPAGRARLRRHRGRSRSPRGAPGGAGPA